MGISSHNYPKLSNQLEPLVRKVHCQEAEWNKFRP